MSAAFLSAFGEILLKILLMLFLGFSDYSLFRPDLRVFAQRALATAAILACVAALKVRFLLCLT